MIYYDLNLTFCRTYESIGRMFLLNDIDNVKKNLQLKQKSAADKIETLVVGV